MIESIIFYGIYLFLAITIIVITIWLNKKEEENERLKSDKKVLYREYLKQRTLINFYKNQLEKRNENNCK